MGWLESGTDDAVDELRLVIDKMSAAVLADSIQFDRRID